MELQMKLGCSAPLLSAVVPFVNYILFHLLEVNLELFAIEHFKEQNALTR